MQAYHISRLLYLSALAMSKRTCTSQLDYVLTRKVLMFAMRIDVCNCSLVVQLYRIITFFALNIRFCRFEQTLLLRQI